MRMDDFSRSEREFMVDVAKLYYEQELTQDEIGRRLKTSRSTVSRLLKEAREMGVVQISINYLWERDLALEAALVSRFGLREAKVLKSYDRPLDDIHRGMGYLAAHLLNQMVSDHDTIGISYGRSIAHTIQQVAATVRSDVTVVQIIGALGSSNPLIEGIDLTRELARRYDARYRYLHSPLIVENAHTRDLLVNEPSVRETLTLGRQANIVLMGIGTLASDHFGLIWRGYLDQDELIELRRRGAVGHMCAQFFDRNGQLLGDDLSHRSVSIGIEALRDVETVVAIAGGEDKAEAIRGAMMGHFLNILVTEDTTARQILQL